MSVNQFLKESIPDSFTVVNTHHKQFPQVDAKFIRTFPSLCEIMVTRMNNSPMIFMLYYRCYSVLITSVLDKDKEVLPTPYPKLRLAIWLS